MQQAGNYGGGGYYLPPSQPAPSVPDYGNLYSPAGPSPSSYDANPPYAPPGPSSYASTAPPSYNFSDSNYDYVPPGAPSYGPAQEPTYPPQEAPNYGSSSYAPSQPSYAPAVPSFAPAYDNYNSSAPYASTPPAQAQGYLSGNSAPPYTGGSYLTEAQTYGSGGLQSAPGYGGAQMGYQQAPIGGQGVGGYEQGGGGSSLIGKEYDRDGYSVQRDSGEYSEVYAYGGGPEPYGARGTGGSSWNSGGSGGGFGSLGNSGGSILARATPKMDTDDAGGGVQKYRVKMLPDMSSPNSKDVICQIGLDGVRMLDPSSSVSLRVYPLETITRWEVNDPSVFTFWARNKVDIEQRAVRLQSSSHTTSLILDTITAACVQLCEMVGKDGSSTAVDGNSTSAESTLPKKNIFTDWVPSLARPVGEEEKHHWVPDEASTKCRNCAGDFSVINRRHHCRNCGEIFCDKCTRGRTALTAEEGSQVVRVCDPCLAEVTQRLSNTKEASKVPVQRTHEDLAKKLQAELARNAGRIETTTSKGNSGATGNTSTGTSVLNCSKCGSISLVTGSNSRCPSCGSEVSSNHGTGRDGYGSYGSDKQGSTQGSGRRTREVACPTCTVHLQVNVPSYGQETVECGVCQHPFLVNA